MSNVVKFPTAAAGQIPTAAELETLLLADDFRERASVLRDIKRHVDARRKYAQAVAWTIAAESEGLPAATIEQAHRDTAEIFEEMQDAGRSLVICMPTDPKALVDLLLYMEKNFSTLPQEVVGRSLALELIQTVRLSLRRIAKYGKSK